MAHTIQTYSSRNGNQESFCSATRQRFINRVCLFVILLACGLALCEDATMFRGNLQHTGIYGGAGIEKFSQIKWKFHTTGRVIASSAVAGGTVYVGSTDGSLYALDLDTGTPKWKFNTKARITSSPAVSGGIVYFESYDGKFYALDAISGQKKWEFQTGGERRFTARHIHGIDPTGETMPDPFDFYFSSPAVWTRSGYFCRWDGNIYGHGA